MDMRWQERCGTIARLARIARDRRSQGSKRRPAGAGTWRASVGLLSVALVALALSPTAAQAQVYIRNDVAGNDIGSGKTSGTVGQSTLHLAQPFTTPASGSFLLDNVVLHFSAAANVSDSALYLYSGKENTVGGQDQLFAPEVPNSGRIDAVTHELPDNDPGQVLKFDPATDLGGGRYQFDVPTTYTDELAAGTTYHLYLWAPPNRDGPTWEVINIAGSGPPNPPDVTFTGHTAECSTSGDWAFPRGLDLDPKNPTSGWNVSLGFPPQGGTFVTEIHGNENFGPTGSVAIVGSETIGQTLEADLGNVEDDNDGPYTAVTYQWSRAQPVPQDPSLPPEQWPRQPISGETSQTYVTTDADRNSRLAVLVSYVDNDCYENTPNSAIIANTFATGLAMSGTTRVGETLTAEIGGISDQDGLTSPSYSYQWTRVASDGTTTEIDDGTGNAQDYVLIPADHGSRMRVTVSFQDDDSNDEKLNELSGVVSTSASGLKISGGDDPRVGETLTAEGITDPDGTLKAQFNYRWSRLLDPDLETRRWDPIAGATSQTYTPLGLGFGPSSDDWGKQLRVTVTFMDDLGNEEELSAVTARVVSESAKNLRIAGRARVDETLTAEGITDRDELRNPPGFTYQWYRVEDPDAETPQVIPINGAIDATYTPDETDDHGKRLRVTVTFKDALDNDEEISADHPDLVSESAKNLRIAGRARVGETLTADTSGITDRDNLPPSPSYEYQWTREGGDGSVLSEEATYPLLAADHDSRLRLTVTFKDALDNDEELSTLSAVVSTSAAGLGIAGPGACRRDADGEDRRNRGS